MHAPTPLSLAMPWRASMWLSSFQSHDRKNAFLACNKLNARHLTGAPRMEEPHSSPPRSRCHENQGNKHHAACHSLPPQAVLFFVEILISHYQYSIRVCLPFHALQVRAAFCHVDPLLHLVASCPSKQNQSFAHPETCLQ